MKELKSYIEAKTFEDKVGEILSALCVGDEIVVKEHFFHQSGFNAIIFCHWDVRRTNGLIVPSWKSKVIFVIPL